MTASSRFALSSTLAAAVLLAALLIPGLAAAETLLIERVQEESMALPARGMSMAQVESRFGAPADKLDARGGQKRQWPTIHRWAYPDFVVYFEKDRVIDAVTTRADASEIGPKPPIR